MEKLLKLTDMSKFLTAIRVADGIRNAIYAVVIMFMALNVIKLFKGISKE